MDFETIGGWLLNLLIIAIQGVMLYGFGRLLYVGGGITIPNPFQPGWSTLYAAYRVEQGIPRMESISTLIGMVTYRDLVDIGFDEHDLLLRKNFMGTKIVRIPYADIRVVRLPGENTVLRIKVRTDGIFDMGGVKVSLQNKQATKLLARLAQ